MTGPDNPSESALAFLTVIEDDDGSCYGGLLAVNLAGRPLEFHCTAPLRPNRAQQILYGGTLTAFVYGEQIAPALLGQLELKPQLVLSDQPAVLALQRTSQQPVVLLARGQQQSPDLSAATAGMVRGQSSWQLGSYWLTVSDCQQEERPLIDRLTRMLDETVDLDEPFGRIREAIQEAQRSARAA